MTTALPILNLLDGDLRVARSHLIVARKAYEHSPNVDRRTQLDLARTRVDELLDACLAEVS